MTLIENSIILRRMRDSDRNDLARLADNRNIWNNVRDYLPSPYTEQDAEAFIHVAKGQKPLMIFAIEYEKHFCGVIGLVGQTDVYKRTAEIGYWLGEPYWNKGISTVAVRLITDYGLHTLDFIRLHAGIFEYNTGSMRVLEKNGYEKDGVFKKSVVKNGKIWNEHRYSITK